MLCQCAKAPSFVMPLYYDLRQNANCIYERVLYAVFMTDNSRNGRPPKKWPHLKNGLRSHCPRCGNAPLFQAYLKPVETCSSCGQDWRDIRSELAPAWAAMTLSAHIVVPIYHFFIFGSGWPNWAQILFLMLIATAICLVALPRMKGLFMALVWYYRIDES